VEDHLEVAFHPRILDRCLATVILLVGLTLLLATGGQMFWRPTHTLDCDRTTCHATYPSLFGDGATTIDLADLRDSRVTTIGDQTEWTAKSHGKTIDVGLRTSDDDVIATYQRLAPQLQAFLDDPTKPTFSARYPWRSGLHPWLFLVLGVLVTWWGGRWIRGWHAELVFDKAAGTVTIRQRPFGGRRTIPLADIARIEGSDRVVQSLYGAMRYARLRMIGKNGKVLWHYRTMFDAKSHKAVTERFHAMQNLLLSR
jgi:hypothetical protein